MNVRLETESLVLRPGPPLDLAIEHEGEPIGSVGLHPLTDVSRFTADVGYWIGEALWGRVLEKAGYELEATLGRSAFKDGRFVDCSLYVRFRPR